MCVSARRPARRVSCCVLFPEISTWHVLLRRRGDEHMRKRVWGWDGWVDRGHGEDRCVEEWDGVDRRRRGSEQTCVREGGNRRGGMEW